MMALVAGIVAGFFLALYRVNGYKMPIGWDTARYLDQTNLVARHGLAGVSELQLPRPSQTLTSRVGFPVTVLTISKLLGGSTFQVATILPVVAIAGAALAAGAFVTFAFRRSVWDAAVVALVVGTSAAMVRLIAGTFTDNLLAAAVFGAALIPLVGAAGGRRGLLAAVALLAAGGLIHTAFFGFLAVTLGLVALLYAPSSWRAWRRGESTAWDTPTGRLGLAVGGATAIGAVGIYGILRTTPSTPEGLLSRAGNARRLRDDLPLYRLAVTVPIAAVGLAAVGATMSSPSPNPGSDGAVATRERPFAPRFAFVLMLTWGLVAGLGIAGFYLGRNLPAHRFLAFLLPLPILGGLGLLAVGRLVAGRAGRVLGAAVVLAGLAGAGLAAHQNLYGTLEARGLEWINQGQIRDAATAQRYLDAVGVLPDAPVVYVIDDSGPNPQEYLPELAHIMRTTMTATRVEHASFYVGTPQNYLARRPTILPNDTRRYNVPSGRFWHDLQPVLAGEPPVALVLDAYNPAYGSFIASHPEAVVGAGVAALEGPRPNQHIRAAQIPGAPQGGLRLAAFGIVGLVVFTLLGVGWAVALLPDGVRPFEVLSVSIGFGAAFLVGAGTLVDAAGLRLGGSAGAGTAIAVAGGGWILGFLRLRRHPDLFWDA